MMTPADKEGVVRKSRFTEEKMVSSLRELEQENVRLMKILVDRDLEIDVMKEIAEKKW